MENVHPICLKLSAVPVRECDIIRKSFTHSVFNGLLRMRKSGTGLSPKQHLDICRHGIHTDISCVIRMWDIDTLFNNSLVLYTIF